MKTQTAKIMGKIAMYVMIASAILVWFAELEFYLKIALCYVFIIQAYNENENIKEVEAWS